MIAWMILSVAALFAVAAADTDSQDKDWEEMMQRYMAALQANPCYPFQDKLEENAEKCQTYSGRIFTDQELDDEVKGHIPPIYQGSEIYKEYFCGLVKSDICKMEAMGAVDEVTKKVNGDKLIPHLGVVKNETVRAELTKAFAECIGDGTKSVALQVECIGMVLIKMCETEELLRIHTEMDAKMGKEFA